jgi:hypothetical protein
MGAWSAIKSFKSASASSLWLTLIAPTRRPPSP